MSNIPKKNNTNISLRPKSSNRNNTKSNSNLKNNKINNNNNNKLASKSNNFNKNINTNNKKIKSRINSSKNKSPNKPKKINSSRTSAQPYKKNPSKSKKTIDNFDVEYENLNNLCNNKKNFRGKEAVEYMIRKNKEYKENKIKQKKLQFKNYDKLYKNFINLEKNIKKINIHKINKEKKKKEKDDENEDENNEISNGSIENNNLEKKYYLGCLDVKWILSDTKNVNNLNNEPNQK